MIVALAELPNSFWDYVDIKGDDDCWEWQRGKHSHGYGLVANPWRDLDGERQQEYAHRASYQSIFGKIPTGMHTDHICRNVACVNPMHLEVVSMAENIWRSPTAPSSVNRRATHCVNGHEFNEENTYWRLERRSVSGRTRMCRQCGRDRNRQRNRKKRWDDAAAGTDTRPLRKSRERRGVHV